MWAWFPRAEWQLHAARRGPVYGAALVAEQDRHVTLAIWLMLIEPSKPVAEKHFWVAIG